MNIIILDTETTGLDESSSVIEVGAILYSTTTKAVLSQVSSLINWENMSNPAQPINKISVEMLKEGAAQESALDMIYSMSVNVKYLLAHNTEFDKKQLQRVIGAGFGVNNVWVDTQDFTYPNSEYCKSTGLINLACAHSIPIIDCHRALDDCRTIAKLLSTIPDLDSEIIKAARPKFLYRSLEEKPGTLSKQAGFKWHSLIPQAWAKKMPAEDAANLPFKTVLIE
ncbi:MAG: hypothetical protein B7C55_09830 [Actinomycetales bacterium mxb001]|nr:MAG: hypothetical protein B7C55_09830 [Actinomycetales bacterium mxb001]